MHTCVAEFLFALLVAASAATQFGISSVISLCTVEIGPRMFELVVEHLEDVRGGRARVRVCVRRPPSNGSISTVRVRGLIFAAAFLLDSIAVVIDGLEDAFDSVPLDRGAQFRTRKLRKIGRLLPLSMMGRNRRETVDTQERLWPSLEDRLHPQRVARRTATKDMNQIHFSMHHRDKARPVRRSA